MFTTIIIFIAVLAVLVLSHEWGHFYAARRNGIRVDEFGFGFPPRLGGVRLLRRKPGADQKLPAKKWEWILGSKEITEEVRDENYEYGTLYSFNLLPLGGFVKIKGENATENGGNDADSFATKKAWQKALVLCAGVGMNVVVAIVLITAGMLLGAPQDISNLKNVDDIKDRKVIILGVMPGQPAEKAGIQPGDAIIKLDDLERPRLKELQAYVDEHRDRSIALTLERESQLVTVDLQPVVNTSTNKAVFGVGIMESGVYPWYKALYMGTVQTFQILWAIILAFYAMIKSLVTGHGVGAEVSGPVGVAKMTGQVARLGFMYLMQFTAMLSLNLAVLNILPIPALDGGRLLFVIIGKIMRRPVTPKIEQWAHVIGFMFLMLIVILATGKDLNVVGWVQEVWQKVF
jgi:regulator of sigma E protease